MYIFHLRNTSNFCDANDTYNAHIYKASDSIYTKQKGLFASVCLMLLTLGYFTSILFRDYFQIRSTWLFSGNDPIFHFTCWDSCNCLPPQTPPGVYYIHQSYKTSDSKEWASLWTFLQKSWTDQSGETFRYAFWTERENDLLAKCTQFKERYFNLDPGIKRANAARMIYLWKFGGLYVDLDYIALRNHIDLFNQFPDEILFLQQRSDRQLSLEWIFARKPGNYLLRHCLRDFVKNEDEIEESTGSIIFTECFKDFYQFWNLRVEEGTYESTRVVHQHKVYQAPWDENQNECQDVRNRSKKWWQTKWKSSKCYRTLDDMGTYAFTTNATKR